MLRFFAPFLAFGVAVGLAAVGRSADCNSNQVDDAADLEARLAFAAAQALAVGAEPCALEVADLDGDLALDVAVANRASGSVTLLLGAGRGRLPGSGEVQTVEAAVAESPCALRAADLDGDGDLDLAVTGGTFPAPGWVIVLWNRGSGSFEASVSVASPGSPSVIAAADLDGDGDLDLAVGDRGRGGALLVWNLGGGAFAEGPLLAAGRSPVGLVLADFDGDDDVDLAAADELTGAIQVLWNSGRGELLSGTSIQGGRVARTLVHGDFNGDGRTDLVAAYRASGEVQTVFGDGAGSFQAAPPLPLAEDPVALAAADADRDGDLDVFVLVTRIGDDPPVSSSSLRHSAALLLFNTGQGAWRRGPTFPLGPPASALAAADLDGNGRPDLAAAHAGHGVLSVAWSAEDGVLEAATERAVVTEGSFAAADFDRDGRLDILLAARSIVPASLLWNGGDGDFSRRLDLPLSFTDGVRAGDIDGDGLADLVIADRPAPWESLPRAIAVLRSNGNRSFTAAAPLPLDDRTVSLTCADLDGDGDVDIARLTSGRSLRVLRNLGGGAFEPVEGASFEREGRSLALGDLDGDRRLDAVVAVSPVLDVTVGEDGEIIQTAVAPGWLSVLEQEASGGFTERARLNSGTWPESPLFADFDGDGLLDLAAADRAAREVWVWRQEAPAEFVPIARLPAGIEPRSIAAGDLDADGDVDLAAANAGSASVSVFAGCGDGTFAAGPTYLAAGRPQHLAALDLDGRGALDLAVLCEGSDDLWVLRNRSLPPRSSDCNRNRVPDECDLAAGQALDADGDGLPDECGRRFRRGDANDDGTIDVSDAVAVLGFLFLGVPRVLGCDASADIERDGLIDVSDAIRLLAYLFLGAREPPAPFRACGFDTEPSVLGCEGFAGCP
jgi:hypothetical protein